MQGLLRRSDVEKICKVSRATLYRYIKARRFPAPVRLGKSTVRWRAADVAAWLEQLPDRLRLSARVNRKLGVSGRL
jgi:prophage regulatory protein